MRKCVGRLLGIALLFSGASKVAMPGDGAPLVGHVLGVPDSVSALALVGVSLIEIFLECAWVADHGREVTAYVTAGLLVTFSTLLAYGSAQGYSASRYKCFGELLPVEFHIHMVLNGGLLLLCVLSLRKERL